MMTLCTLFNVNYLDKGLALYESLEKVSKDFVLYVLAMDDRCYDILYDLKYEHLIPIRLNDFEDEELLYVKPYRSFGEYCFTCSSNLIWYILKTYQPDYCTYIDADLYFYSDPSVAIDEMVSKGASVLVTGHRFNWYECKENTWEVGPYCVEFNIFKNDEMGLYLLDIWRHQCIEYCSADKDGIHYGDQKYLEHWCDDYDFVIETQLHGLGVGPWNIPQYKLVSKKNDGYKLKYKNATYDLIFYHFENIKYIERDLVNINVYADWGIDDDLIDLLYPAYLQSVDFYKKYIKSHYNIDILIKSHPEYGDHKHLPIVKILSKVISGRYWRLLLFKKIPSAIYKHKNLIRL